MATRVAKTAYKGTLAAVALTGASIEKGSADKIVKTIEWMNKNPHYASSRAGDLKTFRIYKALGTGMKRLALPAAFMAGFGAGEVIVEIDKAYLDGWIVNTTGKIGEPLFEKIYQIQQESESSQNVR
jgi:hypothetical protein